MRHTRLIAILIFALLLAGCGGQAEPTPTKTPHPTATFTPLPTLAVAVPRVETGQSAAPTDTPLATGEQVSPLVGASPLETPTPTALSQPTASATPGLEAQPPVPVLAADLACGQGCTAGNPDGIGAVILNLQTGQINTWAANMDVLDGELYEGWVVLGDQAESTGTFNANEDGSVREFNFLSGGLKDVAWASFVLTIEPAPDPDKAPAAPHSIGGPFRSTVMGEAFFNRFDIACNECHGSAGEGGTGPALAATDLPFGDFLTLVQNHGLSAYTDGILGNRDLQHIYAWLVNLP